MKAVSYFLLIISFCSAPALSTAANMIQYKLQLKSDPSLAAGKVAVVKGMVNKMPQRFFIENVDILQPVMVTLFTKSPDTDLNLTLHKYTWDEKERSGSTHGEGFVTFRFRTQGDFQVQVFNTADKAVPYYLVVWAGDDVKPTMPPAVVTPSVYEKSGRGTYSTDHKSSHWWIWVMAVLVVAVALMAAYLFGRKRNVPPIVLLLLPVLLVCAGIVPNAHADDNIYATGDSLGNMVRDTDTWPGRSHAAAVDSQLASSKAERDQIELNKEINSRRNAIEVGQARRSAIGKGMEWTNNGLTLINTAQDIAGVYKWLTSKDSSYAPDYSPNGSPMIPTSCAEKGSGCYECYLEADKGINFTRFYLAKMHSISSENIDYAKKAISVGDSLSGFHAMSGLAWQTAGKPQIEQAVTQLRQTYSNKYQQYMEGLDKSLKNLAACEAQYYDNPDWYQRFGFIYYTFIEERYRSPD